jgi:hypothetical protein
VVREGTQVWLYDRDQTTAAIYVSIGSSPSVLTAVSFHPDDACQRAACATLDGVEADGPSWIYTCRWCQRECCDQCLGHYDSETGLVRCVDCEDAGNDEAEWPVWNKRVLEHFGTLRVQYGIVYTNTICR